MALDFLHAVAIAALVSEIETLGDDAIASSAGRLEPFLGVLDLAAGRRQTKKCSRKAMVCECLQFPSTLRQHHWHEVLRVPPHKIEGEKLRRRLLGQSLDTARGRMNALKQSIE